MSNNIIKNYLIYLLISLISIFIVDTLSYNLIHHNIYTKINTQLIFFELPLFVLIITLLYFPKIQNRLLRQFLPLIPILGLYSLYDGFYSMLLRSPRLSDFGNFTNLYDFFPSAFFGIIIYIFLLITSMLIIINKAKQYEMKEQYIAQIIIRFSLLLAITYLMQTSFFKNYHNKTFQYTNWSKLVTIKKNGKFSTFIYLSNQEKDNKLKLALYSDLNNSISDEMYHSKIINKQNIYIVIMESFIDPRNLKNSNFNKEPLHPSLKKYLNDEGSFSLVNSPVYGGNTPQAEFEVLTGIPALAKINTSEFNVLNGHKIDAFISMLKENDYNTIATIASGTEYYNSPTAYKSLGLENIVFLEDTDTFSKNSNHKRIFDGDVFEYNIKRIKNNLKTSNKPFVSYILGLYGHMKFERNKDIRPDTISIDNNKDTNLHNITNQFYYRTQALAKYIDQILALDKDALIYITSDHLPPILNKNIEYKYNKYVNISLLLNKGIYIEHNLYNHYQIPWKIWSLLSKETSLEPSKIKLEQLYFKALYEATL